MTYRYVHRDGRKGEGYSPWSAIHNAMRPWGTQGWAFDNLEELKWVSVPAGKFQSACEVVEMADVRVKGAAEPLGTLYLLRY